MADSTKETAGTQYSLSNPATSLADIIAALQKSAGSIPDTYTQPAYQTLVDPSIRSAQSLADQLGVQFTYDRDAIEKS